MIFMKIDRKSIHFDSSREPEERGGHGALPHHVTESADSARNYDSSLEVLTRNCNSSFNTLAVQF